MKKKFYITLLSILAVLVFSFSYTFATNNTADPAQGIRNFVGGAENVVEDAGQGIASGIRNITSGTENGMESGTDTQQDQATANGGNNQSQQNVTTGTSGTTGSAGGSMTSTDNASYSATRTATGDTSTVLGMDSTMWTWLIMAIVGIAIIALVWMYAKQKEDSYNNNNNY